MPDSGPADFGPAPEEPGGIFSGIDAGELGKLVEEMPRLQKWPVYLPRTYEAQNSYLSWLSSHYPKEALIQESFARASQTLWDQWHNQPGDPH